MPVYEYQCLQCNHVFEIMHRINKEYQDGCPRCHGKAKRILSPSNFILKGSGFYVNDYPSKSRKKPEPEKKEPEKTTPAKAQKTETHA